MTGERILRDVRSSACYNAEDPSRSWIGFRNPLNDAQSVAYEQSRRASNALVRATFRRTAARQDYIGE